MQQQYNPDNDCMNYVSGNKIFLLAEISPQSVNELIGNLCNLVHAMKWHPVYERSKHITNPYQLASNGIKNPVIDVYINSYGGSIDEANSIMSLLNLARAKGAIIRTTNMGVAGSVASHIAIQGTPTFRIMYEKAYNFIHYGSSQIFIDRGATELEKAAQYEKEMRKMFHSPYLSYTDITPQELAELQQTEYGFINATDCMDKKICDWILTDTGKLIDRQKLKQYRARNR